jgi:hypothetical protein
MKLNLRKFTFVFMCFALLNLSGLELFKAVNSRDLNLIEKLIENGASINQRDFTRRTPLMYAARLGDNGVEVAKFLIERGANLNIQDEWGDTALMHANSKPDGNIEIASIIEESGQMIHMNKVAASSTVPVNFPEIETSVVYPAVASSSDIDQIDESACCAICLCNKCDFKSSCGHFGHKECLKAMINTGLNSKDSSILKCYECAKELAENDFREIIGNDLEKLSLYDEVRNLPWMLENNVKNCPTPDCDFRFTNEENRVQIITCLQCHKKFCANCLIDHNPKISCKLIAKNSELKQYEWTKRNAKPCPKCYAFIERASGCPYVSCTVCKTAFCYVCYGSHHVRKCENEPVYLKGYEI